MENFKLKKILALCGLALASACSSLSFSPRSNPIFGLKFSEQPPRTLIEINCNSRRSIVEGVAVCESRHPLTPEAYVKIMPLPGRVVLSDGLQKKTIDFNWRKGGWIWKQQVIDTTWVPLDLGEISSIYGDVPVAFDVQGMSENGLINTRGIIYSRICNDKDVPCSKLIVSFDCGGKIENTYLGQIGSCARISGSSQKFSISTRAPHYQLHQGAMVRVQSGRTGWQFRHEITVEEIESGQVKFLFPEVQTGPDLFTIAVYQWEQGVLVGYHAYVLLVGSSPDWTGTDRPHFFYSDGLEFCLPFLADLLEVSTDHKILTANKGCVHWPETSEQVCAFSYARDSGDQTYTCVKNRKEVRW